MNSTRFSLISSMLAICYAAADDATGGAAAGFAAAVGAGSDPASDAPAVTVQPIANGKETTYFFKTEKIKDAAGKVIGDGRKHPDVKAILPYPTEVDVINFLSHAGAKDGEGKPTPESKVAALIMEGVSDLIFQAGRAQINDWLDKNEGGTFTATNFDLAKLTLEYISTLEKGSRGAWAPSEEELKAFNEDYTNVFLHIIKYDAKKVPLHCEQFAKGFSKIKNDKRAVEKMLEFLTGWASNTTAMEEHADTYQWLVAKASKYLKAEEKNYADAL